MSSSDSEAFESADEDFEDVRKSKPKSHAANKSIIKEAADDQDESQKLKEDVKDHRKQPAIKEEVTKDQEESLKLQADVKDLDAKNQNKITDFVEIDKELLTELIDAKVDTTIKEMKVEKQEVVEKNVPPKKLTADANENVPKEVKVIKNKPIAAVTEAVTDEKEVENEIDAWDFDAWDDSDPVDKGSNETAQVQKVEAKLDEKSNVDDEGWEFDDWGDDETVQKSTSTTPINDSKKSNLVENLSKLIISTEESKATEEIKNETSNERISGVFDKLSKANQEQSSNWGGWKPWGGVVSLLSTATDGMASLTSHVSSVIESGMGVPDPAEIARAQKEEQIKQQKESPTTELAETKGRDEKSVLLGNIVSGVSQISNRVLSTGLDTLEGIGKKTMTMLQENDPGLLKKRKLLGLDKDAPCLSQILREAKTSAEETEKHLKQMQKQQYKKQLHFETLFDDYHGLVHLEALEMLSKQSTIKLQTLLAPLSGIALDDLQETLNEVKELCELPDDPEDADGRHSVDDLTEKLNVAIEDLDIPTNFSEIINCWRDSIEWLETSENNRSARDVYEKALRCLAQTAANSINKMHKLAELLLIKDHHSTANEADSLVQLTSILCWHLSGIATKFGDILSQLENEEDANTLITSVFLEGSNSTLYIQNAFQLFIPILQIGAA